MGKGGIVFYFWEADATEKGSLGPNTVVNSNQKKKSSSNPPARTVIERGQFSQAAIGSDEVNVRMGGPIPRSIPLAPFGQLNEDHAVLLLKDRRLPS